MSYRPPEDHDSVATVASDTVIGAIKPATATATAKTVSARQSNKQPAIAATTNTARPNSTSNCNRRTATATATCVSYGRTADAVRKSSTTVTAVRLRRILTSGSSTTATSGTSRRPIPTIVSLSSNTSPTTAIGASLTTTTRAAVLSHCSKRAASTATATGCVNAAENAVSSIAAKRSDVCQTSSTRPTRPDKNVGSSR